MKLHIVLGVCEHTNTMVYKLKKDKDSLVVVVDYELKSESESVRKAGVLYCSPNRAKSIVAEAEQTVFHRIAYIAPRLME